MQSVQPTSLTTKELVQYADALLIKGQELPVSWQRELVERLGNQYKYHDLKLEDPRQMSLF